MVRRRALSRATRDHDSRKRTMSVVGSGWRANCDVKTAVWLANSPHHDVLLIVGRRVEIGNLSSGKPTFLASELDQNLALTRYVDQKYEGTYNHLGLRFALDGLKTDMTSCLFAACMPVHQLGAETRIRPVENEDHRCHSCQAVQVLGLWLWALGPSTSCGRIGRQES